MLQLHRFEEGGPTKKCSFGINRGSISRNYGPTGLEITMGFASLPNYTKMHPVQTSRDVRAYSHSTVPTGLGVRS